MSFRKYHQTLSSFESTISDQRMMIYKIDVDNVKYDN